MKKIIIVSFLMLLPWQAMSSLITINLNDFYPPPFVTEITVSPDGNMVDFVESPFLTPLVLINDPWLGDPNVIIPEFGRSLVVDLDFMVGAGNDDQIGFFLFDAALGPHAGLLDLVVIQYSIIDQVFFNLTDYIGLELGLSIEFAELSFFGLESTAHIANMHLVDQVFSIFSSGLMSQAVPVSAVPEPSTLAIFVLGIIGFASRRIKKQS